MFSTFIENAHPIIQERLKVYYEALKEGSVNASKFYKEIAGEIGAQSEIVALDKALKAREKLLGRAVTEREPGEFVLHNQPLLKEHNAPPRCANCWYLTEGIEVIGND